MSDHYTLEESQEPIVSHVAMKPHILIARYISIILSPIVVSLPLITLVGLYRQIDKLAATGFICLTLLFMSIGPMFYVIIGVLKGKFKDFDLTDRTERAKPFLFGISSAAIGLLTMTYISGPKNLQTMLLITIICGGLMMLITFWWKISIHASALSSAITFLTALYGTNILPVFSLVVLVGWSRVVLRRHTLGQVIAGSLMGLLITSAIVWLRGI